MPKGPSIPCTHLPPETKLAAEKVLAREGVSMSAYLRLAVMHLVAAGEIPFPDKHAGALRTGRPRKVVSVCQ